LIWIHDGIERKGAVTYFTGSGPHPQNDEIQIISHKDLEPNYSAPRSKEPEFMRWNVSYVGASSGSLNHNSTQAKESKHIHIGMLALDPAQKEVPYISETEEVYIVLSGHVIVSAGSEKGRELERLDGLIFHPGEVHALRNYGRETTYILTIKSLR
jgi:mannose-6-phosphate isomerase-like protein (cupin superfamily)